MEVFFVENEALLVLLRANLPVELAKPWGQRHLQHSFKIQLNKEQWTEAPPIVFKSNRLLQVTADSQFSGSISACSWPLQRPKFANLRPFAKLARMEPIGIISGV